MPNEYRDLEAETLEVYNEACEIVLELGFTPIGLPSPLARCNTCVFVFSTIKALNPYGKTQHKKLKISQNDKATQA